jgi:type IV pilus biogenesis protein CpaD/CtpE
MKTHVRATAWLLCGGLATMMTLSGCGNTADYLDPYKKPYTWTPTGAATANLAAQLVNPRDLVAGRGAALGDGKEAGPAVDRVWQDHQKALLGSGSDSGPTASAGAAGASAGGASGGSN